MRFSELEKNAIKKIFQDFRGDVYLFGSRLNDFAKGGDIDLLIKLPKNKREKEIDLLIKLKSEFCSIIDQEIDIIIYKENDQFCEEIIKNAKKLSITEL